MCMYIIIMIIVCIVLYKNIICLDAQNKEIKKLSENSYNYC